MTDAEERQGVLYLLGCIAFGVWQGSLAAFFFMLLIVPTVVDAITEAIKHKK